MIATMTSVPPAIGRVDPAASSSYASNKRRGESIGGSAGINARPDPTG